MIDLSAKVPVTSSLQEAILANISQACVPCRQHVFQIPEDIIVPNDEKLKFYSLVNQITKDLVGEAAFKLEKAERESMLYSGTKTSIEFVTDMVPTLFSRMFVRERSQINDLSNVCRIIDSRLKELSKLRDYILSETSFDSRNITPFEQNIMSKCREVPHSSSDFRVIEEVVRRLFLLTFEKKRFEERVREVQLNVDYLDVWQSFMESQSCPDPYTLRGCFIEEQISRVGHPEASLWALLEHQGLPIATMGFTIHSSSLGNILVCRNIQASDKQIEGKDYSINARKVYNKLQGENWRIGMIRHAVDFASHIDARAVVGGVSYLHSNWPYRIFRQYRQSYRHAGFIETKDKHGNYNYLKPEFGIRSVTKKLRC